MFIRDEAGDDEAPINLMPLIDMVFLLLIFFLVASTFAKEERRIDINLPAASASQPLSAAPQELVINILANGDVVMSGQPMDLAALGQQVAAQMKEQQDAQVFIRADEQSRHGRFAEVVRVCRDAGVKQLKIGYVVGGPGGQ